MLGILIDQEGDPFKFLVCHSASPVFMRPGERRAFADIRSNVGHGLTARAGNVAGDLRSRLHEEVAQGAGDRGIVRPQRDAHPLLGVVVVVHGVVAPVGAVVVPDVVVGIRICIFHAPTSTEGVRHPLS